MVDLINSTGVAYDVLNGLTSNVTGSWVLTFLLIMVVCMLFAMAFRIPVEITTILVFPLGIAIAAQVGTAWLGILGLMMLYLAFIIAKNFISISG